MRVLISLLLLAVSPTLFAAGEKTNQVADDWKALRCVLDKNGDSTVSQEESVSFNPAVFRMLERNFAAIDSNKDGVITEAEFTAFFQGKQAAWNDEFKALDTDHSGGLSKAELEKAQSGKFDLIRNRFDEMDTNKDGQVTLEERDQFIANARMQAQERKLKGSKAAELQK